MNDIEFFGTLYEKGDVIFEQGDVGDTLYVIQSGVIEISCQKDGKKIVLNLLKQGEFFGEMALIDDRPRSATAAALARTRLLPINKRFFSSRTNADISVILQIIRSLCHRIDHTNHLLRSHVAADEALSSALANTLQEKVELDNRHPPEEPSGSEQTVLQPTEDTTKWPIVPEILFHCEDLPNLIYDKGETIFEEGDEGQRMFVVVDGEVEIYTNASGKRLPLARLGSMSFFGEMSLITGNPRAATAVAIQETRLMAIDSSQLSEKIGQYPDLALFIIQVLVARLRACTAALEAPEHSAVTMRLMMPPVIQKQNKIRLAMVSLSSCGGCTAMFLENRTKLIELSQLADIVYCPMLMDAESFEQVDIALVDGAVRMTEDETILQKARRNSRILVAWGTCAVFGGLPAMANQYELEELFEESFGEAADPFSYYMSDPNKRQKKMPAASEETLLRKVRKLDDIVKVDYFLPGCPPDPAFFIHLARELKGETLSNGTKAVVCTECLRKPAKNLFDDMWAFPSHKTVSNLCFLSQGVLCMGLLTKGGCKASCVKGGLPCWGCRGPTNKILHELNNGGYYGELMSALVARRTKLENEVLRMVVRILRQKGGSAFNFENNFVMDPSRLR